MSRVLYMAFAILVGVMGLAFYVRNDQKVQLNYFTGSIDIELSLVIVGALVLGVVLGIVVMAARIVRLRRELRRLARRNELATRELDVLRAAPVRDAG